MMLEDYSDPSMWEEREDNPATPGGAAEPSGAKCADCGLDYNDPGFCDLVVPDDVWRQVSPTGDGGGILCPTCLTRRVAALNLDHHVPVRFFGNGTLSLEPVLRAAPPETAALVEELRDVADDLDREAAFQRDQHSKTLHSRRHEGLARVAFAGFLEERARTLRTTHALLVSALAASRGEATTATAAISLSSEDALRVSDLILRARAEAAREFVAFVVKHGVVDTPHGRGVVPIHHLADRFLAAGGTPDQEGA